jgi:ABC-type oligopeptide transport system substrate-binding subunit
MAFGRGLLAFVFGIIFSSLILHAAWSAGQAPARKPPAEEEEASPRKIKPPPKVEEDDADTKRQAEGAHPNALAQDAEQAANPVLRKVFRDLSIPFDTIVWKKGNEIKVEPISTFVSSFSGKGSVNVRVYDEKMRPKPMQPVPFNEIKEIHRYEDRALAEVDRLLNETSAQTDAARPVSRNDRLTAADKILAVVLRFSDAARSGAPWEDFKERIRSRLLAVQMEQLTLLADQGNWQAANELAERLPQSRREAIRDRIVQQLVRLIDQPFEQKNYSLARQRFQVLEEEYSETAPYRAESSKFEKKAKELFQMAQEKDKGGDRSSAADLIAQAESIWPRLADLRDYRLRLTEAYPALGVGVQLLPENLSPATAVTDSEKQATELLFESLVRLRQDPTVGEVFEPELAQGRPEVVPLGRRFRLVRDAYWSNGDRVTASDVRSTVRLLKKPDWEGYDPSWAELLADALPSQDPFEVTLKLRQGFLEPLTLMTFKILPASVARPDDPDFAQRPVGSGPYKLRPEPESRSTVFVLNENYHRAEGRPLPQIREVRFFHSENPSQDFQSGKLHLLLDLPTPGLEAIKSLANVSYETYRNRRVYFLAVNHRVPALQDQKLRKALAHSINRSKILDDVFRSFLAGTPNAPHRPLNSPFPSDCWVAMPSLKADPFDPALAKGLADEVRAGSPTIRLKLKYPEDDQNSIADRQVRQACEAIRDQLRDLNTGIELDLIPRKTRELHREVELDHDYELAYYHYDFPDDLYWLWPLFNTNSAALERGGTNYLGYRNDSELESEFQAVMTHRDFARVQQAMRAIQGILRTKMPLIPLWQLDTNIAFHKDLFSSPPKDLDPLVVFADIEKWKLGRK